MRNAIYIVIAFIIAAVITCATPSFAEDSGPQDTVESHFGIVCNPYLKDWEYPEKTVAMLKRLGVRLAICKMSWKDIEVEKGKFSEKEWKVYDEIVNKLTDSGIDVMCYIEAIPQWTMNSSLHPGSQLGKKPKRPRDLADFATAAAGRYKGKIKRWAFFNSPQSKRRWFNPEYLARLYKVGGKAIRREIPDCVIVMSGLEGVIERRGPYLERFLQAGGGEHVDMYDFHMNLGGGTHFSASASATNALKDILKRYNQSGKPIQYGAIAVSNRYVSGKKRIAKLKAKGWAPIDYELVTPEVRAIRLVTLMIWGRSLGMDKTFWTRTRDHAPDSGPEYEKWLAKKKKRRNPNEKFRHRGYDRTMGIINYNHEPKPSFNAFKTLIEKLDTADFHKELNVGEDAKAFIFKKEDKYIGVFWTWEGKKSLALGVDAKRVTISDLYGRVTTQADVKNGKLTLPITRSVIYVEGDFKELKIL